MRRNAPVTKVISVSLNRIKFVALFMIRQKAKDVNLIVILPPHTKSPDSKRIGTLFFELIALFCGFLCFETVEFVLFKFQIHPFNRRADRKQELRKREKFGRIDEFAFVFESSDHTFCDVLRFLDGERTLANDFALLTFHCFFEEARVGGYRIEASEGYVARKFVAKTLLEALHCEFTRAVKRITGHCEFADCRNGDCHLTLFAAEIFDVFLVCIDGRIHVDFEDVFDAFPVDVVHRFVVREAGVCKEDVDRAEFFGCGRKDGIDVFFCGHVAHHREHVFEVESLDSVGAQVYRQDFVASVCEQFERFETDTAVRTGDDDGFAVYHNFLLSISQVYADLINLFTNSMLSRKSVIYKFIFSGCCYIWIKFD